MLERGDEGSADIPLPFVSGVSAPPVEAMLGAAIFFVVLALPFMVSAARRFGKRWIYSQGMLAAAIVFPLLFFVGLVPGVSPVWQALIFAALVGLPLAPVQTFPNALIADITDYDALQTGMRREATYYATQAMFEKLASALAPALLGVLLFIGSSADNPLGIRLVGPVAGAATLVGYLLFRRYWLPDTVTAETVRAAVSRRRWSDSGGHPESQHARAPGQAGPVRDGKRSRVSSTPLLAPGQRRGDRRADVLLARALARLRRWRRTQRSGRSAPQSRLVPHESRRRPSDDEVEPDAEPLLHVTPPTTGRGPQSSRAATANRGSDARADAYSVTVRSLERSRGWRCSTPLVSTPSLTAPTQLHRLVGPAHNADPALDRERAVQRADGVEVELFDEQ